MASVQYDNINASEPIASNDSIASAGKSTPTTNGTTNGTTLKESAVNILIVVYIFFKPDLKGAASAVNAVKDHPITQNVVNGPVATSIKNQAGQTSDEFGGLANSRAPPSYSAANDTPLTNYHSFFYTLLSWEHPRATGITFGASVVFIFACRYLPVIRYMLKISYMTLGIVTLAEIASKAVAGTSVASSIRPRRYYKIPKETLEMWLDDLEQFINFFVIEVQRIVFAENIPVTAAAFSATLLSYFLVKILPFWGMALLATCVIYIVPLIYVSNKELIDSHVEHATNVVSQQATQVKDLTAQHAGKGFEAVKSYTGDYASKATEMIGQSRQKIPILNNTSTTTTKEADFPTAPKTDLPSTGDHTKPVVAAPTKDGPIAASAS